MTLTITAVSLSHHEPRPCAPSTIHDAVPSSSPEQWLQFHFPRQHPQPRPQLRLASLIQGPSPSSTDAPQPARTTNASASFASTIHKLADVLVRRPKLRLMRPRKATLAPPPLLLLPRQPLQLVRLIPVPCPSLKSVPEADLIRANASSLNVWSTQIHADVPVRPPRNETLAPPPPPPPRLQLRHARLIPASFPSSRNVPEAVVISANASPPNVWSILIHAGVPARLPSPAPVVS